MGQSVIVWDIETVPDLRGFAVANDFGGKSDEELRAALGEKFPKHVYHSIVCIGALVARRDGSGWVVDALGAPHCGERLEKDLIAAFVGRIAELTPQLVYALDLCDVLSGFSSEGKVTLHEICRVMGLPGKPQGIDGSEVAQYHRDGRIQDIADYCETAFDGVLPTASKLVRHVTSLDDRRRGEWQAD